MHGGSNQLLIRLWLFKWLFGSLVVQIHSTSNVGNVLYLLQVLDSLIVTRWEVWPLQVQSESMAPHESVTGVVLGKEIEQERKRHGLRS